MFGVVILAMLTIVGGALALRTGRVLLQRSADRARAAAAARRAAADEAVADRAAADARHRAHPEWLVTLQSTLLRTRIHPLEQRQGQLTAERDEIKAALDAAPPGPSLVRKLLGYAALLLLPLLFLLSVYQLVPSFYTLSGSGPLALFGGVLVAAIEIGIAFALARVLYQPDKDEAAAGAGAGAGAGADPDTLAGRRPDGSLADRFLAMADSGPGWAKAVLAAAMTLTAAGLLVWGQYTWAPAHDVIPLQGKLTVAEQTYAQDQQNGVQQTLLTSDRLVIDSVSTKLAEVRGRDQALALLVPLAEDAVALPALGVLGFAAQDLRRLRRRRRLAGLSRRIGALDIEIEQARDAITLELQRMLEGLGIDPAIATATVAAPPATAIPAGTAAALPAGPGHPVPGDHPAFADHPVPGHRADGHRADGHRADAAGPRTFDDLFPPPAPGADQAHPATGDAAEADDHGNRWTDPL
jgi:hypothetical protein